MDSIKEAEKELKSKLKLPAKDPVSSITYDDPN